MVHCSATREGHVLTPEALESEHRRRGFCTPRCPSSNRTRPARLPHDGLPLLYPERRYRARNPFPGTARCALPRSQQVFDRYLLRRRAGCPGKSEGYPYAGAAFGPAPAGVPAATTVPERPCMRPPRPQPRFGRRWDGGAVGVGEAVSVLRGK